MTTILKTSPQTYVRVPRAEYRELKKLQRYVGAFWQYLAHRKDIHGARQDVAAGRTIPQEKFFKSLGI